MKNYMKDFEELFNKDYLTEHSLNLYRIERKQTFPAYINAAKYTYDLLKNEGFESEYLEFPADGKTVFQDKCMPIGWDVKEAKLSLITKISGITDPVIADFSKEPISVVKHSVSTPPEGIVVKIVTEAQMLAGEDVKGALVLLNQATHPMKGIIRMLLDLGAVGWVSDFLENPHRTPDSVNWLNAGTEYNAWHVQADDRDFIAFNITPRTGFALRNACEHGVVKAHILSDAKKYETVLPAVTALLRGESEKEVWIVSHLHEPLVDDNSTGVIGSIAILKAIREMAQRGDFKLKYSIRVVFASEMYGVAAVCEHFGGDISQKTIGGINTDGIIASFDKSEKKSYVAAAAPDLPGFAGNILMDKVGSQLLETYPDAILAEQDNYYGDDCFISDATIGCPCIWLRHNRSGFHHNGWLDETVFDVDAMVIHLAYCAIWIRAMAALSESEAHELLPFALKRAQMYLSVAAKGKVRKGTDEKARMEFIFEREKAKIKNISLWGKEADINEAINKLVCPVSNAEIVDIEQKWYDYTDGFVFRRLTRGFPHDLVKVPREKRKNMPGTILYDTIADIVSRIDGKKSLMTLIQEVEWDRGIILDDRKIQTYFKTFIMLCEAGYFDVEIKNPLNFEMLTEALEKLGVKKGDTIIVHSALSNIGYIPGGADTVIRALRNVVGEEGTFLSPVFTNPYIAFEGRVNKDLNYRPYDTRPDGCFKDKGIDTGALGIQMLKQKDSVRSNHSTHEWVAIGKKAQKYVDGHKFLDAPSGETSPLKKVLDNGGKIIFLGCSIKFNTFIHYVETVSDAPFLQTAIIKYIDENGSEKTDIIKKHLPGHRSFYDGLNGEFYTEAVKRGLKIHKQEFGMAELYIMDIKELYDISMEMFRENPLATLCTSPDCTYCRKFRIY